MEIYKIHKGEINYDPSVDYRKTFRRVVGLNDILRKILIRSRNPLFDKIKRHLPLLLKAANVSLSDSSMQNDDANNKLLELYIALAVMGFAIDLELDHPKKSSGGTNPDIIFDYQNIRWAIACKSLHSEQTTRLRSQIEDGVSQIDSSDAQKGIVIVKITNLIDHDKAWGINIKDGIVYYDYYEENITKQHFYNMAQDVACRLASVLQENDIELIFGNSKAIPYVLGFFSTVTGLTRNGSN